MSTLEIPDPQTSPTFGRSAPDPAEPAAPPDLPQASAEPEPEPDGLPRGGSACRYCGVTAARDALVVGGTVHQPPDAAIPEDATSHRMKQLPPDALAHARMEAARTARDDTAYGRATAHLVVREVVQPHWRVCESCADLPRDPDPVALTLAGLGHRPPHPRTPVTVHVAERHAPSAYYATAGAGPRDRGHRQPWSHAAGDLEAAAALLADLEGAGGVPSATGRACGVCGATHTLYGWSGRSWFPPPPAAPVPGGAPLCGGWRTEPGDRTKHPKARPVRRRVGCEPLVYGAPPVAGPVPERAYRVAKAAEADLPPLGDVAEPFRMAAACHPDYPQATSATPRPAWWHVTDGSLPLKPLDPAEELRERLEALEGAGAG